VSADAAVAAVVVVATLVLMTSGRVPAVLALGLGLAASGLLGLAPPAALFAGLSNAGVVTVGAMLVIAKGIVQTGAINRVTWALLSTATSASQALRRLVLPVGTGSALMNTTPIVAMLVPAAKELEQTRRIPAREILLPIAHVTTLAGSVTLIGTSSNLLIAGIAQKQGVDMGMVSFTPVALPVAVAGTLVIFVTARVMLRGAEERTTRRMRWRVEIPVTARALATGRLPAEMGVASTQEYELVEIQRWGEAVPVESPIEDEDVLVFAATEAGVRALWGSPRFGLAPQRLYLVSVGMGEHGHLRDLEEGERLRVVAARTDRPLRDTPAVPGSTCFVTTSSVDELDGRRGVGLWQDVAGRTPQPHRTWRAAVILVAVILSASFGLVPIELAAFTGALLMVVGRVLTPTAAARALDWNVLLILAGSVGLGSVVVESGLADVIATGVKQASGGSMLAVVVVFAVVTTLLTNLVTNAAAASILTPVALSITGELGVDPVTLLALIGTCISFTFINPFSHQSNLMVLEPGGYTNAQFARFGVPLIVAGLISVVTVGYLLLRP
jgi:di/tricarboxylate transporter